MFLETPMFVLLFCSMFKQVLTKPQKKHFGLFMTQRMICSPKHQTMSHIKRIFLKSPSINAFSNFLNTPTRVWKKLKERRKEILIQKFKSKKGALIIDDTFCYKTGKRMRHIFKNFCHVLGKKVLSHVVVTSVYKTPKVSMGYDFKVYIPKKIAEHFKTKYELALEIIKDAYKRNLIKRVYFDSWFCQPTLLKKIKPMKLEFFGMFRIGKMKVRSDGVYMMLSKFVEETIKKNKFIYRRLRGRKKSYKIRYYREIVFIKHIGKVNLVVSQKYDQKTKIFNEPRVYATNVLNLRALEVIRTYLNRWDIEMFHKTVKQSFGFEDYQVIEAQARDAYFELAFLSDMLLQLKRLGQLDNHRASRILPCTAPTEKVGSEDLVLDALAAQKKGTLKEFIQMCGFMEKRFQYFL
ncbi:transposase [Candidatus Pacearchaeota archaeon]|nr:transposase [Candidatus Pacearchaeota archaeon]